MAIGKNKITVTIAGQNQAAQAFRQTQTQLNGLRQAAVGLGGVLKGLAIGIAVYKLIQLGQKSNATADQLAKMSRKTGVSVEMLSGLAHAADLSGSNIDGMEKGLLLLSRSMDDAARGSRTAIHNFQSLGVNFRDARGNILPLDKVLEQVAKRFAEAKDGPTKAALALKVFGRAGADLIPFFSAGPEGLRKMREEAERLGKAFTTEAAEGAEELRDNMTRLQGSIQGLANRFLEGLGPSLSQIAEALTLSSGKMDLVRKAGEAAGWVIRKITLGFYALAAVVELVGHRIGVFIEYMKALFTGNFARARELDRILGSPLGADQREIDIITNLKIREQALGKSDAEMEAERQARAAQRRARDAGKGAAGDFKIISDEAESIAKALASKQIAAFENAARLSRDLAQRQIADLEWGKSRQLISISEFYQAREAIQRSALEAELTALEKQREAADALVKKSIGAQRVAAEQQVEKLAADIIQKQRDIADLGIQSAREEAEARQEFLDMVLDMEDAIAAAKGRTADAAIRAIDREFDARRRMYEQEGMDTAGLDELQTMLRAKALAEDVHGEVDLTFQKLNRRVMQIHDAMARGQLDALQGEAEINAARRQAADSMDEIIGRYEQLAKVSGDPRLIENAAALKAEIESLRLEYSRLGTELATDVSNSFGRFFHDVITGNQSIADSFRDLARNIIASIAAMIAKMLEMTLILHLLQAIFGLFGFNVGSTDLGGLVISKKAAGGGFRSGEPFIAGERGPELIVPDASGRVFPNSSLRAGQAGRQVTIINQIDARGAAAGVELRILRALRDVEGRAVTRAKYEILEGSLRTA